MMLIFDFLLFLLSGCLLVPVAVLFFQLMRGIGKDVSQTPPFQIPTRGFNIAILMPAHNEAKGVSVSVRSVLSELQSGDRMLVVADNCTDQTATVAHAAGAEVIERHDEHRRGKGYALDFGVRWLEKSPPNVTIIIDADCIAHPGSIARLAADCLASGCPVQALYLMRSPAGSHLGVRT